MDTEELLYDIKRRLDEVALSHEYHNTKSKLKWSDEDLLDLIQFMRDDYHRTHYEAVNTVLIKFKQYKEDKKNDTI